MKWETLTSDDKKSIITAVKQFYGNFYNLYRIMAFPFGGPIRKEYWRNTWLEQSS